MAFHPKRRAYIRAHKPDGARCGITAGGKNLRAIIIGSKVNVILQSIIAGSVVSASNS